MRRLLALLRNLRGPWIADDPNPTLSRLDLMDRGPACMVCPQPALQDGLCGHHGGLPFTEWPADAQARLLAYFRGDDRG